MLEQGGDEPPADPELDPAAAPEPANTAPTGEHQEGDQRFVAVPPSEE
jgi:hypothetical protein